MADAQGSARDHVETEWAEATEDIPGRRTANIPQEKKKPRSQTGQEKLCKVQRGRYYPSVQGRKVAWVKREKKEKNTKAKRKD